MFWGPILTEIGAVIVFKIYKIKLTNLKIKASSRKLVENFYGTKKINLLTKY